MFILTTEQIREEEARGFQSGISYEDMMCTAGNGAADIILRRYPSASKFVVVCGKGKNGGDGFVAAMRFSETGREVKIVLAMGAVKDPLAAQMQTRAQMHGIDLLDMITDRNGCVLAMQQADILVDAVFGIGFSGSINGDLAQIAEIYNHCGASKTAIDIPSGLSADSCAVPEVFFHADLTVTMHAAKTAHCFSPAKEACGEVQIADIGFSLPESKDAYMIENDFDRIAAMFTPRKATDHKGCCGYALSVCGSYAMPGAAAIAAKAAVECGVGLLAAAFPDKAYGALSSKLTEQIYVPCDSDEKGFFSEKCISVLEPHIGKASAVLFGCGAGTAAGCEKVLHFIIKNADCPLILDADGINLLALNIDVLRERKFPTLITPHPGEMARLLGKSVAEINADRVHAAKMFASENQVHVLLKGHPTVIASADGRVYVNPTGNPGMATGGSGDMLSGMILSFAAQGMELLNAAQCGAYLHGMSGDAAAQTYSMMGTTPLRMLKQLPSVLLQIEKVM